MTQRLLPSSTAKKTTTFNGRVFTATAGTTQDAPDWDAAELCANGWFNVAGGSSAGVGTTAQRPTTGLPLGATYLDTTTAALIVWDGATWRNPSSGAAA